MWQVTQKAYTEGIHISHNIRHTYKALGFRMSEASKSSQMLIMMLKLLDMTGDVRKAYI
jgi:hypothetical protein